MNKIQHLDDKNAPIETEVRCVIFPADLKKYEDAELDLASKKAAPSAYVSARQQWLIEILTQSGVTGELRMTAHQVNQNWYALYWGNVKAVPGDPFA